MDPRGVRSELLALAETIFEVEAEELVPEAELVADLGVTSVRMLDFSVAIERELGLRIDFEALHEAQRLGDLLALIERSAVAASEA